MVALVVSPVGFPTCDEEICNFEKLMRKSVNTTNFMGISVNFPYIVDHVPGPGASAVAAPRAVAARGSELAILTGVFDQELSRRGAIRS